MAGREKGREGGRGTKGAGEARKLELEGQAPTRKDVNCHVLPLFIPGRIYIHAWNMYSASMHCTFAFYVDPCASQSRQFQVLRREPESRDAYTPVLHTIGRQTIMWPCYTSDMRRPYNPSRRITFCRAGDPGQSDQGNAGQQWGYVVVSPIQVSGKVGNIDDVTILKAGGVGAKVSVC